MLTISFRAGFFPTVFDWISPKSSWFFRVLAFLFATDLGTWGLLDDQFVNHQDSSLAESSVLVGLQVWARVQHLLCNNDLCCDKAKNFDNPIAAVEFLFEDLSKGRGSKNWQQTHILRWHLPPAQHQAFHEICYAPAGGGASKGKFPQHTASACFCCFEMPIFRAYGIGDPSSYQGAPPSLGGVPDRANSHAIPCVCLFFCVFWVFWNANSHVFLGGFLLTKKTPFSCWCPNFEKMAVPTSRIFG